MPPELAEKIEGALGEGSQFHETFGYYAQGVGPETAVLPSGLEHGYVQLAQALDLTADMPLDDVEQRRLRATIRRWAKVIADAGHQMPGA